MKMIAMGRWKAGDRDLAGFGVRGRHIGQLGEFLQQSQGLELKLVEVQRVAFRGHGSPFICGRIHAAARLVKASDSPGFVLGIQPVNREGGGP